MRILKTEYSVLSLVIHHIVTTTQKSSLRNVLEVNHRIN